MTKEQLQRARDADPCYGKLNHEYDDGFDAGWKVATERVCEWTRDDEWDEWMFEAACGYEYDEYSPPDEMEIHFCPNCGGRGTI